MRDSAAAFAPGIRELECVIESAFWGCDLLTVDAKEDFDFTEVIEFSEDEEPQGSVLDIQDNVLVRCSGCGSRVDLPENFTHIGERAFYGNCEITEVNVPSGVTGLGSVAFGHCINLEKITLPNTINSIEPHAFWKCGSLKEIMLPSGITEIPTSAFSGCRGLESVVIPNTVKTIGAKAFGECISLKEVHIPASVKEIAVNSFWWARKVTIFAPKGSYAQKYAKLRNIPFVVE